MYWFNEAYSDGTTKITSEDRKEIIENTPQSIDDVYFYQAIIAKERLIDGIEDKRERLRNLNYLREYDDKKCPKCSNMKRECRICKEKKPLNFKYFYFGSNISKYGIDGNNINDLEKRYLLGHVCRSCFEPQKKAIKELKKLNINIGGFTRYRPPYYHHEKMMLLAMGRTLVEIKNKKKDIKNESSNSDVYGEQFSHEENHKRQLQA
jgi:ribosomal protein L32